MIPEIEILREFEPITLEEMENVKLMNRTDTKFTLPLTDFPKLLEEVRNDYKVLEVNGTRMCRYETLYYDTKTLDLYYQHHCGKLNRFKLRHRTYVNTETGFLEVKFKNNKGRTIKTRMELIRVPEQWEEEDKKFLKKNFPLDAEVLTPVIWINYYRYTLVNKKGGERVTLDLGLEFKYQGKTQTLDRLVIAEVKQDKRVVSPFIDLMKRHHIREGSVSKYCMAIAMSNSGVKVNNFKMKLNRIRKLNQ